MAHAQLRMTCLDVFVEGQAVHLVMPYMDTDLKKIIEDRRSRGITVSPGGVLPRKNPAIDSHRDSTVGLEA